MKVAIVGSRQGVSPDRVAKFVAKLWEKQGIETVLVSGGANGVDKCAEQTWLALGGKVQSFRIRKIAGDMTHEDVYAIEVWRLGGEQPVVFMPQNEPTWATAASALYYRNLLIAEFADRGVAFWDGRSRGTSDAIDAFHAENKPIHVFREVQDVAQS